VQPRATFRPVTAEPDRLRRLPLKGGGALDGFEIAAKPDGVDRLRGRPRGDSVLDGKGRGVAWR
jgi:hypothetical protein